MVKRFLMATIFLVAHSAYASMLTFDGLSDDSGSDLYQFESIELDGFLLDHGADYGYMIGVDYSDEDSRLNAFNGTDMLVTGYNNSVLQVTALDGGNFSLTQFDATEYFDRIGTTITVSAMTLAGNLVSTQFLTDAVLNDERGSHEDFQTFNLGEEYSLVSSVEFSFDSNGWFALDNLVVSKSVVPLPPALWLFGSALAGLGWTRRNRRD